MQSVTSRAHSRLPLTSRYQGKQQAQTAETQRGLLLALLISTAWGWVVSFSGPRGPVLHISVLSHAITYAFPIPIYTTSGLSLLTDYTRPHILHAPIWKHHILASPLTHPGLAFLLSNQTLTAKCLSV